MRRRLEEVPVGLGELRGSVAEGLPELGSVDAVEANVLLLAAKNDDRVTIDHLDHWCLEGGQGEGGDGRDE